MENDNRSVSVSKISKRFFHFSEHIALAAYSEEERQKAFLRMWVLKEAAVKMAGDRVPSGLQKVKITFKVHPWQLHRDGRKLYVKEIIPFPGVIGALAANCQFVVTLCQTV